MNQSNQQLLCFKTPSPCGGDFLQVPWATLPVSSTFVHSHGEGGPCYNTQVQVAWEPQFLYVRFHCEDDEILATMEKRDQPLYDEEVVEVFLAPTSLGQYFEFNLSPRNVIFDSLITHDGTTFTGHPEWDCLGLKHGVFRRNAANRVFGDWDGYLAIPFECLNTKPASGQSIRANFYRIKRLGGEQFLAWSATEVKPANFHVPTKFGELILG